MTFLQADDLMVHPGKALHRLSGLFFHVKWGSVTKKKQKKKKKNETKVGVNGKW